MPRLRHVERTGKSLPSAWKCGIIIMACHSFERRFAHANDSTVEKLRILVVEDDKWPGIWAPASGERDACSGSKIIPWAVTKGVYSAVIRPNQTATSSAVGV